MATNKIPVMAELLKLLDIKGAVAAADAMHAQRTRRTDHRPGRHCVLVLKRNQGTLHKHAREWLEDPEAAKEMLSHQHVGGGGHGRVEARTAMVSHDIV